MIPNNPPAMALIRYSDKELVQIVDNKHDATPLERELANRIDAVMQREEVEAALKKKGIWK